MKLNELLGDWSDQLADLEQNHPIDEGGLIRFAKDRGIPISGVVTGDPSKFGELGWLPQDRKRSDGAPLFHPFRFYSLHRVLNACRIPVATSASLDRERIGAFVGRVAREWMPGLERIGEWAVSWNRVVSLCIILEPVYWPQVTGLTKRSAFIDEAEFQASLEDYRRRLRELVGQLARIAHQGFRWPESGRFARLSERGWPRQDDGRAERRQNSPQADRIE
ncbi:hypothetical protein, partial [Thiocapsa sp.]|uniref:hypothetical protein n=1 Tax=Thiocapsa sp. TaxID=2024551 RepID=UPI00359473ED